MSKQVDDLETLVAALPDVMYISDASEEVQCEDDERFFGASEKREDLVGFGGVTLVGIYKLVAVQQVEKVEKVKVLGTEFISPGTTNMEIDLGTGGASVAGDPE
jgi:hypothetical protein